MVWPSKQKYCRESTNAIAFAELILVLHNGDWTREEICEQVGISDSCLRTWLRYLRARKLVVISEYRRTAKVGSPKIVYTWNHNLESEDVTKPQRKSEAEYSARYRESKRIRLLTELRSS